MSKIKKSEFKQQLILLVIDKVLLGGIIVLIAMFIQNHLDRQQRIQDATLLASQVVTNTITEHRDTLIVSVHDLLSMLNRYESIGQVTDATDTRRLQEIVENVEDSLEQLSIVNPSLDAESNPLVLQIRRTRSDLVNQRRSPEAFQEDANSVRGAYVDMLAQLRETSVLALESDRDAVTQSLSQ